MSLFHDSPRDAPLFREPAGRAAEAAPIPHDNLTTLYRPYAGSRDATPAAAPAPADDDGQAGEGAATLSWGFGGCPPTGP